MPTVKLSRTKEHRERTLRNLATSLVLYETITTTEAKASAVRPIVERLLARACNGSLADRRYAKSILFDTNAVTKIFEDFAQRWGERKNGFVRITKLAPRPGDGTSMARLELLLTPLDQLIAQETKTKVKVRKSTAKDTSSKDQQVKEETE